jgi:hypothetical protein
MRQDGRAHTGLSHPSHNCYDSASCVFSVGYGRNLSQSLDEHRC